MIIDFRQIEGPLSSKHENFQELCAQLVLREYPEAKPVEGKGGDAGLDTYKGVSPSKPEIVWQAKLFYDPLKQPQKRQIRDSFGKVADNASLTRWILCLPRNLNITEQEWLRSLGKEHPLVSIEWWGESKLRELLARHRDIALEFFPTLQEQPPETSLTVDIISAGKLTVDLKYEKGGRSINFRVSNLSDNVIVVEKICLDVLRWQRFDLPPPIEARIKTFKYEVSLQPRYIGEYCFTSEKFKYARGDVDDFEVVCMSPPGNKYTMRLNFYCCDLATGKTFPVHSDDFGISFYGKGGIISWFRHFLKNRQSFGIVSLL